MGGFSTSSAKLLVMAFVTFALWWAFLWTIIDPLLTRPQLPCFYFLNASLLTVSALFYNPSKNLVILVTTGSQPNITPTLPEYTEGNSNEKIIIIRPVFYCWAANILLPLPMVTLFALVVIRLYLSHHFYIPDSKQTPANLDFGYGFHGLNCTSRPDNSPKVALLVDDPMSYAHLVQGACIIFLFPSFYRNVLFRFTRPLNHASRGRAVMLSMGLLCGPLFCFLYPIYNLIKRLSKCPKYFASSSFAENGMEHFAGVSIGFNLGLLLTVLDTGGTMESIPDFIASASLNMAQGTQKLLAWSSIILRSLLALLLIIVAVVAAYKMITTWDASIQHTREVPK